MSKQQALMPCPFTGPKMFWAGRFVPDKKFIYILWQSQTFCARQKDALHSVKLFFLCPHKSFRGGTKCSQIFGLAQKIWTGTKHFGTCKRTRQKSEITYFAPFASSDLKS
jgi:hypothetical protein